MRTVVPVSLIQAGVTATTTMLAVLIGGWLTVRAQDRLWRRDQDRQWRDIRLNAYTDFIGAVREYVAHVLNPAARITAVPRPRDPGDLMPFFDDEGSRYRERLESTKTALRLVAGHVEVVSGSSELVRQARLLAATRAGSEAEALPADRFDALWEAERRFIEVARAELGLPSAFQAVDQRA
ncbi:hypothetical protein PSN13_02857 [Micromonospora saelicesensis]|uniref:Uncharacterized protein n=1 Tax=Micromonospora saelicesensis TaxID=285676 RepID=A0A328NKV1_9ACTN|nr:hypothetical protein PSN13_02857 [Micromonospora saelicesensis]RAO50871.1 hypothetical protein PSN01_04435 [Micromonospora saelicesensis]